MHKITKDMVSDSSTVCALIRPWLFSIDDPTVQGTEYYVNSRDAINYDHVIL